MSYGRGMYAKSLYAKDTTAAPTGAAGAVDSAPATDVVTRTSSRSRAVADTAAAADTVVSTYTRLLGDSAPATDVVTRSTTPSSRAVPDSAPAYDDFTPLQLSPTGWYRAEDITGLANLGTITTWPGAGGTPSITASGPPQYRTDRAEVAGRASVRFNNNSWFTMPTNVMGASASEIFVRIKSDGGRVSHWSFGRFSTNGDESHYPFDGVVYDNFGSDTRRAVSPSVDITSAYHTYNVRSSPGSWVSTLDSTVQVSDASGTYTKIASPLFGAGRKNGGVDIVFAGDVEEVIVFDKVLTTTERSKMRDYLTRHSATPTATSGIIRTLTQSRAASESAPTVESLGADIGTTHIRVVPDFAPTTDTVATEYFQSSSSRYLSDSAPATDVANATKATAASATDSPARYTATILSDSPTGYWRLGETSGTTAFDLSGNGRNGTITGAVTKGVTGLLTSDPDTAFSWAGSTGAWVDTGNIAAWDTAFVTVEAWIQTTSGVNVMIVGRDTGGTSHRAYQFRVNGGPLEFIVFTGGGNSVAISSSNVNDGVRHHVVGTFDGSAIRVYVDGVLAGSAARSGTLDNGDEALIGARTATQQPFTGTIDEVAFYSTALSASRVASHYISGSAPSTFDVVARVITRPRTVSDSAPATDIASALARAGDAAAATDVVTRSTTKSRSVSEELGPPSSVTVFGPSWESIFNYSAPINIPTVSGGVQVGDVILLIINSDSTGALGTVDNLTTLYDVAGASSYNYLGYRVADATDVGRTTITWTKHGAFGSVVVYVFRGTKTAAPTWSRTDASSTTTITGPSVTPPRSAIQLFSQMSGYNVGALTSSISPSTGVTRDISVAEGTGQRINTQIDRVIGTGITSYSATSSVPTSGSNHLHNTVVAVEALVFTGTQDAVTTAPNIARTVSDSAPATDSVSASVGTTSISRSTSDNAAASDAVTFIQTRARAPNDTAPATDVVTRPSPPASRSVSDSAPATDSVSYSLAQHIASRSVTDSAPATDTVQKKRSVARTVSDTAPASDVVTRVTTHRYASTTSDTAPATDTATASVYVPTFLSRSTSDSAPATDTVAATVYVPNLLSRSVSDTAAATDTVAASVYVPNLLSRTVTDSAPAIDTVLAKFVAFTPGQTPGINDDSVTYTGAIDGYTPGSLSDHSDLTFVRSVPPTPSGAGTGTISGTLNPPSTEPSRVDGWLITIRARNANGVSSFSLNPATYGIRVVVNGVATTRYVPPLDGSFGQQQWFVQNVGQLAAVMAGLSWQIQMAYPAGHPGFDVSELSIQLFPSDAGAGALGYGVLKIKDPTEAWWSQCCCPAPSGTEPVWTVSPFWGGWVYDAGTYIGVDIEDLWQAGTEVTPLMPAGANSVCYIVAPGDVDFTTEVPGEPWARLCADVDTSFTWDMQTDVGGVHHYYIHNAGDSDAPTESSLYDTGSHLWILWNGDEGDPEVDPHPTVHPLSLVPETLAVVSEFGPICHPLYVKTAHGWCHTACMSLGPRWSVPTLVGQPWAYNLGDVRYVWFRLEGMQNYDEQFVQVYFEQSFSGPGSNDIAPNGYAEHPAGYASNIYFAALRRPYYEPGEAPFTKIFLNHGTWPSDGYPDTPIVNGYHDVNSFGWIDTPNPPPYNYQG